MWSGRIPGRNKQRQLAGSRLVYLGLVAVLFACSMLAADPSQTESPATNAADSHGASLGAW